MRCLNEFRCSGIAALCDGEIIHKRKYMITNKEMAERIRTIANEIEQDKSSVITLKYERTYSMMFGQGTRVKAEIKTDYGDVCLEFQDIDKKPTVGESSSQPSEQT